ncbi:hypothetical protein AB434_1700 [Heyndrickxia coagulans]|uniref:Uncharacterized protein n=1 Tax=Heyndrickxia coagulans TaxID=1398 RepID=A0AAN0T9H9_HEYCO|nr:hypothetical protein SB48_HM08orf05781 [Heyndrickxia coagulans]AKN54105.1 hypothetical protein AB434_1700 [Heyndrickxia coagulans]
MFFHSYVYQEIFIKLETDSRLSNRSWKYGIFGTTFDIQG